MFPFISTRLRRRPRIGLAAGLALIPFLLSAQSVPTEVGTTVAGFQDDFDGAALNPAWTVRGQSAYALGGGILRVTSASGDPNHLLYELGGYSGSVQEVLARIRVTGFGSGDPPRAGLSAAVDPLSSQGINWLFRDEPNAGQRHMEFLDDARQWGPEFTFGWQNNTWYWLRLRHEPNAASQGGANDVFAKVWLADGVQAEPGAWQMVWDYTPTRTARTGYAGIAAGSLGGVAEFEVDYILIKSAGLPSIFVAPSSFVRIPVTITNQPQSRDVVEGAPVTFTFGVLGQPVPAFQWYRGDVPIAGATNADYTLAAVQLTDAGVFHATAQNVVSNLTYRVTSSDVVLTVAPDDVPPALVQAQALSLTQVQLQFSERMAAAAATNRNHYAISNASGPIAITEARLDPSQSNVVLGVGLMVEGATYTLVANGLTDASSGANPLAPDTTATFTAVAHTAAAIGDPQPPGSVRTVPGGLDVTAGGAGIGGAADQFQFQYQPRAGDFDVRVRIAALDRADAWSHAGLVAREDVTPGSRFAGALATPSISGAFCEYRAAVNGAAASVGAFPVNYPDTWLRLRRAGAQFTAFAGLDGEHWTSLGTVTLALPATVLLGLAVASETTNATTTAAFRDLSEVVAAGVWSGPLPVEPPGQSSRRTSLVISEIMFNPLDRADARNLEFVELFNASGASADLSGWQLDGAADYRFPSNTVLAGGAFLVVAQAPADVEAVYGIRGVLGPFSNTNSLPNTRGTLRLRNPKGAVFLEASYDTAPPWPAAADGAGHSLVLARPSYGQVRVEAWAASDAVGGSPGRLDPVSHDPLRAIVINEFLAHTDPPASDYVELYNRGSEPLDLGGCFLTDARNTNKFTVPAGTVLPPGGFIAFDQAQLGFALDAAGETLYLRNPSATRVLDAIRFGPQARGVARGRSPDGGGDLVELATPTPGAANAAPLRREVVINEIMYHPISGNSDDEYVELYNRGAEAVDLAGWRLEGGIEFTFPASALVPAGGYLVVARNAAWLRPRYAQLNETNTVGDYAGSLGNSGDRIALAMPEVSLTTNQNVVRTNLDYVVVNEVLYQEGGRWGQWSDGGGSSLELIDPRSDNRWAPNWADSDESAKAPWTPVSVTGVLDNGTTPSADQLQVLLQGRGECLIDNVEVLTAAGANLVANATFESGVSGWTAEGTEERSGWETAEGYASARSYHVRASDRGDNQLNRIRTPLSPVPAPGVTNTIRAQVRWLRGHPEILFRLRGSWLEAAAAMSLPTNLGTPGVRNSRALANAAPAIREVAHAPVLPAAGEAVVVSARVADPDGLAGVELRYRIDPGATLITVPMRDDGTGGDPVADDGQYSATLPGQAANTLVAFHVQATDAFAPAATGTFPSDAPARECLVRFGESVPAGNFPVYRIWMTQATFNAWDARHNLNNTLNDVTFVLGNYRAIYNAAAVYAGSPYIAPGFTTPTGNRCGYSLEFPVDDPILGDTALVLDWPGGHGNENTAVQEQMAYWIADRMGLPFSHRYYIRLIVNGVTDLQRGGIFEAVLQPGGDYVAQWSPGDSSGDFYKIDRAFEFDDSGNRIADPMPQLKVYSTRDVATGGTKKKTEAYRWMWLKRFYDRANDYTNIFLIADVLNATNTEVYTAQTEALADVEEWMGVFAAEHIINNFDSWGHDIGKNMYMYKPDAGRWQLYLFDLDWLMLVSPGGPGGYTASTGPLFASNDPTVTRMYTHPPFRRAYFRAVQAAVERAFVPSLYEAEMDARYRSLVANGITMCDGQPLAPPAAVKTWFSQRRAYLVSQLATVDAPFTITSNGGNDFTAETNLVRLAGTAPVAVERLRVNGVEYPVTWTSVNAWSLPVLLSNGVNALTVQAYDGAGNALPGLADTINVTTGTSPESVAGQIVLNEILYEPPVPGAEFVELYNRSATTTFNLSGWRLNGLDFVFPDGTLIEPGDYLVVVKDRTAFATAYGYAVRVAGEFSGHLDRGGETISLVPPGALPDAGSVLATVTYDAEPPWPAVAQGSGVSLQLVDAAQEPSRVANWSDGSGWRFFSQSGYPGANATSLLLYLAAAGDVYVDDVALVEGAQPAAGVNLLGNGDFESGVLTPWKTAGNHSNSTVLAGIAYSGQQSLHLVAGAPGGSGGSVSQTFPALTTNKVYTLSFRYRPSPAGNGISFRVSSLFRNTTPISISPVPATPGARNSVAGPLPALPPVWINELLPNNVAGLRDNAGDRDPWVELYNAGAETVSLDGWHLADNATNLLRWAFPSGSAIGPGEFLLVWLDGEPEETVPGVPHANFRAAPTNGLLELVFPLNTHAAVLDYVRYDVLPGRSTGLLPDGQPGPRRTFLQPTPGATNDPAAPALPVLINEWMAANTAFLVDPADGAFDDWFELYNPNPVAVDLSGYGLSDQLAPSSRWIIPAGTQIAPLGFLLVWADDDVVQNGPASVGLHADFKLSQGGEAVALFAPNGQVVDAVAFGPQTNNVSQGRWPDGEAAFPFMPTPTPGAPNRIDSEPAPIEIVSVVRVAPGTVALTWTSQAGGRYVVRFKDTLGAGAWSELPETVAAGSLASATNAVEGAAQRFYRVERR